MLQDFLQIARRLRAKPSQPLLASALLALAIGLTAATFTLVDSLLLRPAPFRDAGSFAQLGIGPNEQNFTVNIPLPLIKAWRGAAGFSAVHAMMQQRATFGIGEEQLGVAGARVTPGLFEDLGAAPMLGRTFATGDGAPGRDDLAVIAETFWRTRYGGDPSVVGRRVEMNGAEVLIVGVMPASFAFPFAQTRVWRPLDLDQSGPMPGRRTPSAYAYVRLSEQVPRNDAGRIATEIAEAADPANANRRVILRGVTDSMLDPYSAGTVKAGAAAVALVFLALCANVLNLTLAGLAARRREFALCSVLGASRVRLLRQAVGEQLLIGGAAALLGLGLGGGLIALARRYLPLSISSRTLNPIDLDVRAVMILAALSALAMIVAGVVPAWFSTRHDPAAELQSSSRGASADRRSQRLTTGLLVGELALAVALCVGAGIQLRSFVNLLQENRGLDADLLSVFELSLAGAAQTDGAARYAVAEHLRSTAASLAGVSGATLSFGVPPSRGSLYRYDVRSGETGAVPVELRMNSYLVMPDFFQVFGIRVVEGRGFAAGDPPDAVVVSRSLADRLWSGMSAVGRSMQFSDGRTFRVIGVTGEIRNPSRDPRSDEPEMYEPLLASAASASPALASPSVHLTVRCGTGCPPLEAVRSQLRSATSSALVYAGTPVTDDYAVALERPRAGSVIALAFAAIALLAVGAGLFAVLSRAAWQRRREFGIRLALGATPSEVSRLVRSSGLRIGLIGIAAGGVLAIALGRMLASVQYQVTVADPLIWAIVVVAIGMTVLASTIRPARQAATVDPVTLLRAE